MTRPKYSVCFLLACASSLAIAQDHMLNPIKIAGSSATLGIDYKFGLERHHHGFSNNEDVSNKEGAQNPSVTHDLSLNVFHVKLTGEACDKIS